MTMYARLFLNGKGKQVRLDFDLFKHFVDTALAAVIAPTFSSDVTNCIVELSKLAMRAEQWVKNGGDLDPEAFDAEEYETQSEVPIPVNIEPKVFVELLGIVLDRMFRVYGEFREDVRVAQHHGLFVEKQNTKEIAFYSQLLDLLSAANNQAADELEEAQRPDEPDEIPRSRHFRHNPITVTIEDI